MKWRWLICKELALFLLAVTSVFPTLFGTFIFDDGQAILENEDVTAKSIRNGTPTNISRIWWNDFWGTSITHPSSHKSYRPLTTLTFRFEYGIWGQNPFPFHLTNWILHGINSILVFHFLRCCFILSNHCKNERKSKLSKVSEDVILLAAMFFAVHPVHVEPLGGLVGRADLVASLIFLTGFIIISSLPSSSPWTFLLISIISITGSLFKENCFVLVIFYLSLLVFDRQSFRISIRQFLLYSLSVIIISVFIGWRLWFQGGPPVFQKFDNPPAFADTWFSRVFSIVYIWILNIWILVNPTWLSFDWSMGCIPLVESKLDVRVYLVLVFALIAIRIVHLTLKCRTLRISLLIGLPTFLPSSNLIFTVGFVIAERNLYLPSIGFSLFISHAFLRLPKGKLMASFVLVMLFIRSIHRSIDWTNPRQLFFSAQNVCPNNAKVHYNIGSVYGESGDSQAAIQSYMRAIELKPDYYQAMNNLGNILRSKDQMDEAEFWLRKAVSIKDDFPAAWMNLGIVLSKINRTEALECYENALKHRRFYPDCEYNIGNLYLDSGKFSAALKYWIRVITIQPSHVQSWLNIIILLEQENRLQEAKEYAQRALEVIGHLDDTLQFLMGNIYGRLNEYELAETSFKNAIHLCTEKQMTPDKYWSNLGVLYHRWGKLNDARRCYNKALSIQPDLKSARSNLERLSKITNRS